MADLINEWLAVQAEWAAANAAGLPPDVCNKIFDRAWALKSEIAGRPGLHEAIVALCDPARDPDVRLRAALVREHWDVAGAGETLVSVIQSSGATITRPVTMSSALDVRTTMTARDAALCLFNIDSGRGNTGAAK